MVSVDTFAMLRFTDHYIYTKIVSALFENFWEYANVTDFIAATTTEVPNETSDKRK
jgi:hypothetical protein